MEGTLGKCEFAQGTCDGTWPCPLCFSRLDGGGESDDQQLDQSRFWRRDPSVRKAGNFGADC